jgi:hypothetical protein
LGKRQAQKAGNSAPASRSFLNFNAADRRKIS